MPIYLDNAATSFPKPPGVYEAMLRYGTQIGASPGRGQYASSREGARLIAQCRERINTLINGENPDHVVFTLNTSDALNLAIKGVARQWRRDHPGRTPRFVASAMDHNSVLRPLTALASDGAEWTCVQADERTGRVDPAGIAAAIDADTALVVILHASNVAGVIQPVGEIARVCRGRTVPLLVDAAQSLGHIPVDVQALGIDLLAFPGHKGLLGPQGTGGLYIRPGVERLLATTREGGTGHLSESETQPEIMPQKYEAGSHNTIGLVGLSEAVRYVLSRGVAALRAHELGLIGLMLGELRAGGARLSDGTGGEGPLASLRLLGPAAAEERVGVFSFVHDSLSPAEMAAILESRFGLLVRAGLHCAPRAHAAFGTRAGGAFRMSIGPFTTEADILAATKALTEVCAALGQPARAARRAQGAAPG